MIMTKIKVDEVQSVRDIEIARYIPIEQKMALVPTVLANVITFDENGLIDYDTTQYEIARVISTVLLYTNVDLPYDLYSNYDMLCKNGLYDDILECCSVDVRIFHSMLDDALADKMRKNRLDYVLSASVSSLAQETRDCLNNINTLINSDDFDKKLNNILKNIASNDYLNNIVKKMAGK
jgi:hypothetical protein